METVESIIRAGKFLDSKGWVPATSGNISVRLEDGRIAITASGKHKGRLRKEDVVLLDEEGRPLGGGKPSAETLIHLVIYRKLPQINAVVHFHSVNSTLISRIYREGVTFKDYEILKAFSGIKTHQVSLFVPVLENDQNMNRLSEKVEKLLTEDVYGFLIASHGLYTWGRDMDEALVRAEAFEFLFECEIKLLSLRR